MYLLSLRVSPLANEPGQYLSRWARQISPLGYILSDLALMDNEYIFVSCIYISNWYLATVKFHERNWDRRPSAMRLITQNVTHVECPTSCGGRLFSFVINMSNSKYFLQTFHTYNN